MKENCGTLIPNPEVFSQRSFAFVGRALPVIAVEAKFIKFIPTNFETKGIDLDARMFASITNTSSSLMRYWMLKGPLTFNALPIRLE